MRHGTGQSATSTLSSHGVGHYGTTPRTHKGIRNTQSSGFTTREYGDTGTLYRTHEQAKRERIERRSYHHEQYGFPTNSAQIFSSSSNTTLNVQKRERRNSRMTNEQFRATMELLVNPADPRKLFTDFVKIGEGSTGCVYTARNILQNRTVAVKKMNLWKQQRRELLFNEVSVRVCACV